MKPEPPSGTERVTRFFQNSQFSQVDAPAHYLEGRQIEPVDVIVDWGLWENWFLANALKYIARAGRKNGNTFDVDIQKAVWNLERARGLSNAKKNREKKNGAPVETDDGRSNS